MRCCNSSAGEPRRRIAVTAVLLTALMLWGAIEAHADYRDDYQQALEAIERTEWSKAQSLLLRAIAEKPEPGQFNMFQRLDFTPYLPYYYLGLVLYEQDDCEGALLHWKTSRDKGKIRGVRASALARMERACRERLAEAQESAPIEPPVPVAPTQPSVSPQINDGSGAGELPPGTANRPGSASSTGSTAGPRSGLRTERPQDTRDESGSTTAREPRRDRSDNQATRRRQNADRVEPGAQARQRLRELRSRLERLVPAVQATLEDSADLQLPAEAAARRQELETELERLRTLARSRPLRPLVTEQAADKVSALHAGYRAALGFLSRPSVARTDNAPPTQLILAADAFLRADYQRVLDDLGPWLEDPKLDRKAIETGQLLSAAAAYALYLESGKENRLYLKHAKAARAALPTPLPKAKDPRLKVFSPALREFLTSSD